MTFDDKVVLITGSSSGIGAAAAILFAKEGAQVVIVGRVEAKLQHIAHQIEDVGKTAFVIAADISRDREAKTIIRKIIEKFGQLDVLVNNAGVSKHENILGGNLLGAYDYVMNTNLRAVVHLTSLAAPYLAKTKGNIVNISSVGSTIPLEPVDVSYCISKAGLDHFTRCAALELSAVGVRVNVITPGPVHTNKQCEKYIEEHRACTLLNRISEPEEVADLILFLASDHAKSITGACIVADNGMLLKRF